VNARIYGTHKEKIDLRVYVTDMQGIVLFHSFDKSAVGKDFSTWNDVLKTLRGEYGARTTRDREDDANSSVLYVGAPIITQGIIRGALSVGKPSRSVNILVAKVTSELWKGTIVALACLGALTLLLSVWITQPLRALTSYARRVRDGEPVSLPPLGGKEAQELGVAFEEMRLALEGKKYVEHYVQTLTHEIKSPLSSIRGAAELLAEETIDEKSRAKFLGPVSDLSALFSAADVFTLPTIYDPFSNACLEALAAGLPVVTTTANGFSEILTADVQGNMVKPGDIDALAEALAEWRDRPAAETAAACRKLADNYSIERNVSATLEVLTAVAGPP
jgi:signal transduction histidine kinase